MRKDRLTCHSESYPGLLRGGESQGLEPWAPSVINGESKKAGQSWVGGLLLGPGGDVRIPGGGFGQSTFQCSFMPQLGHGPGGGLGFRNEWAWWPSLQGHLKQGPGHFLPLLVDGNLEPCRAVAKRGHLA